MELHRRTQKQTVIFRTMLSWHRVTVYGDVKEPLTEFGKALGLEVIEEA